MYLYEIYEQINLQRKYDNVPELIVMWLLNYPTPIQLEFISFLVMDNPKKTKLIRHLRLICKKIKRGKLPVKLRPVAAASLSTTTTREVVANQFNCTRTCKHLNLMVQINDLLSSKFEFNYLCFKSLTIIYDILSFKYRTILIRAIPLQYRLQFPDMYKSIQFYLRNIVSVPTRPSIHFTARTIKPQMLTVDEMSDLVNNGGYLYACQLNYIGEKYFVNCMNGVCVAMDDRGKKINSPYVDVSMFPTNSTYLLECINLSLTKQWIIVDILYWNEIMSPNFIDRTNKLKSLMMMMASGPSRQIACALTFRLQPQSVISAWNNYNIRKKLHCHLKGTTSKEGGGTMLFNGIYFRKIFNRLVQYKYEFEQHETKVKTYVLCRKLLKIENSVGLYDFDTKSKKLKLIGIKKCSNDICPDNVVAKMYDEDSKQLIFKFNKNVINLFDQ